MPNVTFAPSHLRLFATTGLPIFSYYGDSPFLPGNVLAEDAPVPDTQLDAARAASFGELARHAMLLRSVRPGRAGKAVFSSGPFLEWLQRRQQLRRASLLREMHLPEATAPLFV